VWCVVCPRPALMIEEKTVVPVRRVLRNAAACSRNANVQPEMVFNRPGACTVPCPGKGMEGHEHRPLARQRHVQNGGICYVCAVCVPYEEKFGRQCRVVQQWYSAVEMFFIHNGLRSSCPEKQDRQPGMPSLLLLETDPDVLPSPHVCWCCVQLESPGIKAKVWQEGVCAVCAEEAGGCAPRRSGRSPPSSMRLSA